MWPSPSNSMLPVVNPPTPPLPWKHRRVFHGFGGKRLGATPRWRGPQAERNGGGFSSRWCIGWVGENGRGWIYWLIGCCWSLSQDLCLDVVGYYWKCQNSCRMHLVQGIFKQKSWLVKKWRCLSHFDKRWILKKLPWHFVLHLYNSVYIYIETTFFGGTVPSIPDINIWRIVNSIMASLIIGMVFFFEPSWRDMKDGHGPRS